MTLKTSRSLTRAGSAGEVTYPISLNPRVVWPEDVEPDGQIKAEHDYFLCPRKTRSFYI